MSDVVRNAEPARPGQRPRDLAGIVDRAQLSCPLPRCGRRGCHGGRRVPPSAGRLARGE